ncbi:MAG: protein kinase [Aquabacterium sp.]|nr:protein kinase [Aquabacterium sp.]
MTTAKASAADGHANALPAGTRLGEYEIRRVIGVGGFGIVYLAFDHGLEREVAIKEYMPSSLAARTATLHVSLTSPSHAETFALGLRSFVNEARLLARFDHRSLIKVHRFWEQDGTAYMVMPLMRGHTLREVRRALQQPPDEAWLRRLLQPLLGALDVLHREEVYHRDIAPDNILIGADGVPVLLDFGAARHVISGRTQTLTAILKPAYAPIEQYGEATNLRQGAWTDLYALGATLHYLITEMPPAPATVRTVTDDAPPLAATSRPGLGTEFLRAVDWMLQPRPADRPQSVEQLREVLDGRRTAPARLPGPVPQVGGWDPTAVLSPEGNSLPPVPASAPRRSEQQPPAPAAAPVAQQPVPRSAPNTPVPPPASPAAPAPFGSAATVRTASLVQDSATGPDPIEEAMRSAVRERPTAAHRAPVAVSHWEQRRGSGGLWLTGGAVALVAATAVYWWDPRPAPAPLVAPQAASAVAPAVAASAPSAPLTSEIASAPEVVAAAVANPAMVASAAPMPAASVASGAATPDDGARTVSAVMAGAGGSRRPAVRTRPDIAGADGTGALGRTPAGAEVASAAGGRRSAGGRSPPTPPGAVANVASPSGALAPVPQRRATPAAVQTPTTEGAPAAATENARASATLPAESPTAVRMPETAPAVTGPRDPTEQCGSRRLLALHMCLVRQCVKPQYYDHPECQRTRSVEERARQREIAQ